MKRRKVGRNAPCPCNSGRKYKRCCGTADVVTTSSSKASEADPLALDRMLDRAVQTPFEAKTPRLLYHYTTWTGAQGILSSQQFWATAHDCTNDPAELVSANSVILEVAQALRKTATGLAAEVLQLFLDGYPRLQLTKMRTNYLACFSLVRDSPEQWRRYGGNGRGLCLAIRVLNEPPPTDPNLGSALVKVDYSETTWRTTVAESFGQICSLLSQAKLLPENLKLGLSALYRIAAFSSISAKKQEWAIEQEVRHVTILHQDSKLEPKQRQSGGKLIRYLPVIVRADQKRVALAEILIGPNQGTQEARERLMALLANNGYKASDMEYPDITVSTIAPWDTADRPM